MACAWQKELADGFERVPARRHAVGDREVFVWSARVLQGLAEPARAIAAMVRAARRGGTIGVLDYDHTRAEWDPSMPPTVQRFYQSFLDWRTDAGLDNAIGAHLPRMFEQAGLGRSHRR